MVSSTSLSIFELHGESAGTRAEKAQDWMLTYRRSWESGKMDKGPREERRADRHSYKSEFWTPGPCLLGKRRNAISDYRFELKKQKCRPDGNEPGHEPMIRGLL